MIRSSLVMLTVLTWLVSGCSTARKSAMPEDADQDSSVSADVAGPPEAYGPLPAPKYGPDPVKLRPVVLVLSPGMARGFAHAGVLRVLAENSIPIGAIVGSEMGALIGALYALDPNMNRLEWSMMKFEKEVFAKKGLFAAVFSGAEPRLEAELKRTFSSREISDAQIPMRLALRIKGASMPTLVDRGPVTEGLRAALAADGFFSPAIWNDGLAVSAKESWNSLVREARDLAIGPLLIVNVTGSADPAVRTDEVVLSPDLNGLGDKDFTKRTELTFRGANSAKRALSRIRELTGAKAR